MGPIPLQIDYALTDHVSEAIELYLDDYGHQTSEESKEHVMKLVRTIITDLMPKVSSLLPEKMEDVSEVLAAGSARYSAPDSIRSLDWLQTNGYCIDNMKAGPSTIPDAGRGAFATRRIQEGALISGSPLLRFERDKLVTNSVFSEQLVLNYCFGHPQSTLLLFPYAPLVGLINHNSKSPNVEIRWSTKEENNEISIWTKRSYNRLVKASKVPLMIEYVAKREIQPGEEIFLDYGAEWEAAWKEHVQNWTPPADSKDYVMATTFAKLMEDQPIRTGGEQEEDPYPENLITACYYDYEESYEQYADAEDEEDHLPIFMQVWEETDLLFTCHHHLRPCLILSRGEEEDGETFYTAEMFNLPDTTHGTDLIPDTEHHVVTNIPRRAITFVELMYEGDQHLEGSFRHPIGFPDLIFPETWKNV
uniref:SET domain-containing protein n=1 Tax=Ditylum brightwellii TaxID=49249 RepID=A0A7S1YYF1_9STRA